MLSVDLFYQCLITYDALFYPHSSLWAQDKFPPNYLKILSALLVVSVNIKSELLFSKMLILITLNFTNKQLA